MIISNELIRLIAYLIQIEQTNDHFYYVLAHLCFADVAINFAMIVDCLGRVIITIYVKLIKKCICTYILFPF